MDGLARFVILNDFRRVLSAAESTQLFYRIVALGPNLSGAYPSYINCRKTAITENYRSSSATFISLNVESQRREVAIAAVNALRMGLEPKGVPVREGSWGLGAG